VGDFRDLDTLKAKLQSIVEYKNKLFGALYGAEPLDAADLLEKCRSYAEVLSPFIGDTTEFLHEAIGTGRSILFEGCSISTTGPSRS